jgi:hypothetical protein
MATQILLEDHQCVVNKVDLEELFTQRDTAQTADAEKDQLISKCTNVLSGIDKALPGAMQGQIDMMKIGQAILMGNVTSLFPESFLTELQELGVMVQAYQAKQTEATNLPELPAQS